MILCSCKSKKEAKDQAILIAAEDEFLTKGFNSASMEKIAKDAEVSKRTLYKYYPTKDELFYTMVSKIFDKIEDTLQFPFDETRPIEELFAKTLDIKINLISDPLVIKVATILSRELMKKTEISPRFITRLNASKKFKEAWIIKCQDRGLLTNNYTGQEINDFFHSLIDGLFLWPILLGLKTEISEKEKESYKQIITESFLKTFSS